MKDVWNNFKVAVSGSLSNYMSVEHLGIVLSELAKLGKDKWLIWARSMLSMHNTCCVSQMTDFSVHSKTVSDKVSALKIIYVLRASVLWMYV